MKTLHVVVRDPRGRVESQPIGRAIVAAAIHEKVTRSALRKGLVALTFYQADSPWEAADAMRTLAQLGDVDFDESDFAPQWFPTDHGIATIDLILGPAGRRFSVTVRSELGRLREVLSEARSRGCTFYLVETQPGEPLGIDATLREVANRGDEGRPEDGPRKKRPANKRLQPTALGAIMRRRG